MNRNFSWGDTWATNRADEVWDLIHNSSFNVPQGYIYLYFVSKRLRRFCYSC